jgi:hypothetical protein
MVIFMNPELHDMTLISKLSLAFQPSGMQLYKLMQIEC